MRPLPGLSRCTCCTRIPSHPTQQKVHPSKVAARSIPPGPALAASGDRAEATSSRAAAGRRRQAGGGSLCPVTPDATKVAAHRKKMSREATSCATPRRLSSRVNDVTTTTASNMCQLQAPSGRAGGRQAGRHGQGGAQLAACPQVPRAARCGMQRVAQLLGGQPFYLECSPSPGMSTSGESSGTWRGGRIHATCQECGKCLKPKTFNT